MKDVFDSEYIPPTDAGENGASEPQNGSEPITKDDVRGIKDTGVMMIDIGKAMNSALLDEDGFLIDITDKKGRKADRDFMVAVHGDIKEAVSKAPETVKAVFSEEDKAAFLRLSKLFATERKWVIGFVGVAAAMIMLCAVNYVIYAKKFHEAKKLLKYEQVMIDFGMYVQDTDPQMFNDWRKSQLEAKKRYPEPEEGFGKPMKEEGMEK